MQGKDSNKEYKDYLILEIKRTEAEIRAQGVRLEALNNHLEGLKTRLEGLEMLARVEKAAAQVINPIDLFIIEFCEFKEGAGCPVNAIFDRFEAFRYERGYRPIAKRTLISVLVSKGAYRYRGYFEGTLTQGLMGVQLKRPEGSGEAPGEEGEEEAREEAPDLEGELQEPERRKLFDY